MFRKSGAYFGKVVWQGAILGLLVLVALLSPWKLSLALIFMALFILWRVANDPRTLLMRIFGMIAAAGLLRSGLDLKGDFKINLEPWFDVEISGSLSSVPDWLVFGFAALIVIWDVATKWPELRRMAADGLLWAHQVRDGCKISPVGGGFKGDAAFRVGLNGGTAPLTATNAELRLKGLFWKQAKIAEIRIKRSSDLVWYSLNNPPPLKPGETLDLILDFKIGKDWWTTWYAFWWGWPHAWLPRLGELAVQFGGEREARAEVKFDMSSAPR